MEFCSHFAEDIEKLVKLLMVLCRNTLNSYILRTPWVVMKLQPKSTLEDTYVKKDMDSSKSEYSENFHFRY